jgi:hypothetical protein
VEPLEERRSHRRKEWTLKVVRREKRRGNWRFPPIMPLSTQ